MRYIKSLKLCSFDTLAGISAVYTDGLKAPIQLDETNRIAINDG